jgi:hypothetical protein
MSPARILELIASAFGLAGMYLGSTTLRGAICYCVAIPCLIGCVVIRRLWGLMPLNPSLTPQAPFSVMTLETSCIWLDPSPEPLM